VPQPAAGTGQWVDLFNGRDLSGWVSRPVGKQQASWQVKDGVIVGSGGEGALVTARNDFVSMRIRVEAMINDGGNSGVYFRAQDGEGDNFSRYEAQIEANGKDANKTGSIYLYDMGQKNHSSTPVSVRESPVPANRWFTMEIVADGPHVEVFVEGRKTTDWTDGKFTRGAIGLQAHFAKTVCQFRKVQVMDMANHRQ
jgi:hypothetical protein